jgi:branched-chain amino acid transport system substrate-binding protein
MPASLRVLAVLLMAALILPARVVPAHTAAPVLIGFDGAYGVLNSTSAQAIERGIQVALDEINAGGGVLGGRPMTLVTRDNRSVPARGVFNIREFARTPDLVAVVGGRFSPVQLQELPVIHETGIILLDAWGSADGITAHGYRPSDTFRLSLRDSIGMPVMIEHAKRKGAQTIGLLLPNTGWGRSNLQAAVRYAAGVDRPELLEPQWYNWGEQDMLRHYRALTVAGADAIILVANDIEGGLLVRQLGAVDPGEWVPIISHWGVTGGHMVEESGPTLFALDFSMVQTFSLFRAEPEMRDGVMAVAQRLFGIGRIEDIASPVGFGQAYDLTHLLARAIDRAGTTDRAAVRDALEQLRDYRGLTGNYPRPFSPERHDALGQEQVFMARYRKDGVIVPSEEHGGSP